MRLFLVLLIAFSSYSTAQRPDLMEECAKYYRPKNYLDTLAQLKMPYIAQLPVPNNLKNIVNQNYMLQNVKPTPVMTTKVLAVKTKYVYQNPICVKYSKKQKLCKPQEGGANIASLNKLITKQHFFKNHVEERVESPSLNVENQESSMEPERFTLKVSFDKLEPSENAYPEESRAFGNSYVHKTPSVAPAKVQEMLIEDRLDQLETILPDYRRRRTYETSTIYVTKTITNRRNMATLVVKNCIPVGYEVCTNKRHSNRRTKLAKASSDEEENQFYFG